MKKSMEPGGTWVSVLLALCGILLVGTLPAEDYLEFPDGNREILSDFSPQITASTKQQREPKASPSPLFILYRPEYETLRYKCWDEEGKSKVWQGITVPDVANAAVVRRGREFWVAHDFESLESSKLEILGPAPPGHARNLILGWSVREDNGQLGIQIPDDAPVGDYQIEYDGSHCTAYVIFDFPGQMGILDDRAIRSWGYEDSVPSPNQDHLNHVFYGPGPAPDWNADFSRIYAFRGGEEGPHEGVFGERLVELACSVHGWGANNEMQAGLHLYQIVGQRLTWTAAGSFPGLSNGYYNTFDRVFNGEGVQANAVVYTALELTVETAEEAALGRGRVDQLPPEYVIPFGQCMNFATTTCALARSIGIASRPSYTVGTSGWPQSFHVWAELLVGTTRFDFPGWNTPWWKFDAADQRRQTVSANFEGSVTPPRMHGWGDFVHNSLTLEDCANQGGEFFGRYDLNVSRCDQPANHTTVILKPGPSGNSSPENSLIWDDYNFSGCPWMIVDSYSTVFGTAPSGRPGVETSRDGYALNLLMNRRDGGAARLLNFETNDDLPLLEEGIETTGIVGGLGSNYYMVDVSDGRPVTVFLSQGGVQEGFGARLYGSFDAPPHIRGIAPQASLASTGNIIAAAPPPGSQLLILMVVGEDDRYDRINGQVWHEYALLLEREDTPQLLELQPPHGSVLSGTLLLQGTVEADTIKVFANEAEIPKSQVSSGGSLQFSSVLDLTNRQPWTELEIRIESERDGKKLSRLARYTVREPEVIFHEGFESTFEGRWSFSTSSPSTRGAWVIRSPEEAITIPPLEERSQPGAPASGLQCLYTGRNPAGNSATEDVDNGSVVATLYPVSLFGHHSVNLSYDLWWYNRDQGEDDGDFFLAEASFDRGENWITLQRLDSLHPSIDWTHFDFPLPIPTGGAPQVTLRFTASDGPATGNLIEAAVDNITLFSNNTPGFSGWKFF